MRSRARARRRSIGWSASGSTCPRSPSAADVFTVGDVVPLAIEKPAAGGRMIARIGGHVVLVSGAIPGEKVRGRIDRVARHVAYADTVGIDEPSPDRRRVDADPMCGGCLYAHIAYPRQLDVKRAVIVDAFARIGRLEVPDALRVAASPMTAGRKRPPLTSSA